MFGYFKIHFSKVISSVNFPDKFFDGEVITVANIGQTLPNGDTKVFEITIRLFGSDPELRPAMTTSNVITVNRLEDALYIPLEAVFKTDSTRFVYTYNPGLQRQIIAPGSENANFVVVNQGLTEGQRVLLNAPSNAGDLALEGLDIYEELKRKAEEAKEEASQEAEEERPHSRRPGEERQSPEGEGRGRRGGPAAVGS